MDADKLKLNISPEQASKMKSIGFWIIVSLLVIVVLVLIVISIIHAVRENKAKYLLVQEAEFLIPQLHPTRCMKSKM